MAALADGVQAFTEADFTLDKSRIELQDVLGKGAFSVVYKAQYGDEVVAVKKQTMNGETGPYIMKELAIINACDHRALIKFLGACRNDDKTILIATEYCNGGDLRQLLQSDAALGWKLRARILLGVTEGLTYLHEHGLIHRDIKTENILLDSELNAKLCDFGFARVTDNAKSARPMTMCGTDEFMAPEVLFGVEYNAGADIFSLGVVIGETIARKIPGKKERFLQRKAMDGFTVPKEELREELAQYGGPQSLSLLCEECLADEPGERPSAEDCFNWLDDLLGELPDDEEAAPKLNEAAILHNIKEHLDEVIAEEDQDRASFKDEDAAAQERIRRATFKARKDYDYSAGNITTLTQEQAMAPSPLAPSAKQIEARASLAAAAAAAAPADGPRKAVPMSGYVIKRGGRIKTWRRRFMVITEEGLVYFKTKEDFCRSQQSIQGSLLFEEMCAPPTTTLVAESVPFIAVGKNNAFRIMTNARPRFFCTSELLLTEKWVESINDAFTAWAEEHPDQVARAARPAIARKKSSLRRNSSLRRM